LRARSTSAPRVARDVPALQLHDHHAASSPTASCSGIAADRSPARSRINQGLIRTAAGGTLFLDEVGDLPLDVQPKLLRFLEQGEIMPVGENRPQPVDVRVLAATNADLEQRVAEGKFREDLYYRLSVIRIHVPPLRQRREEIPTSRRSSCATRRIGLGKPDMQLGSDVLDLFAQYWWPGNVRQLRNELQRAVAMAPAGGTIVRNTSRPT
jgi:transcriptional regulator with PAS, ATPase and Fis domain